MKHNLILAYQTEAVLGEGSIWNHEKKVLHWVDILNGHIHTFDPIKNLNETINTEFMVGTVVPSEDGGFVIATNFGFFQLDEFDKIPDFILHPEKALKENRFNDGKCDPRGRFWAGTMSLNEEPKKGSLYCLEKGLCRKMEEGVSISNGIVWTSDHKKMYYVDTPEKCVFVYDFDVETGNISNKKVAFHIPDDQGSPDGMTIDAEDKLWIAHWGGSQVARWDPLTGEKLYTINIPATQVTSVAFGGTTLNDIYITTARVGLSDEELKKQPLAGSLFCYRQSGFMGVKANFYKK